VPLGKGDRAESARGFAGSVVTHAPLCALRGGERFFSSPGKGDDRGWLPPSTESISLLKALFYSLAALVLLSPAVQPWYICWLVPFCVFFASASCITLSGLAVLSYLFYLNFAEMVWPRFVEFGIPAALALWQCARNETRRRQYSKLQQHDEGV